MRRAAAELTRNDGRNSSGYVFSTEVQSDGGVESSLAGRAQAVAKAERSGTRRRFAFGAALRSPNIPVAMSKPRR